MGKIEQGSYSRRACRARLFGCLTNPPIPFGVRGAPYSTDSLF